MVTIKDMKKDIKDLNLIDNVNSQNDHFYVMNKENEYAEFRNISFSFSCIAKYYIGIGYFFSKNNNVCKVTLYSPFGEPFKTKIFIQISFLFQTLFVQSKTY